MTHQWGSYQHLKDSINPRYRASQARSALSVGRAFHFICSLKMTQKKSSSSTLELFLLVVGQQRSFFWFLWQLSSFFLFELEQMRLYIDTARMFSVQMSSCVVSAATQHFPFHCRSCRSRGLQLHWDRSPDTDTLATPRGKANCMSYNSPILFHPSFLPSFPVFVNK